MDNDNREDEEGVVVPLSLIVMLSESMLDIIDKWHEERGIHCLNTGQCIVAMIAAVDAAAETLHTYPEGTTLQ
jgi:hypothetical protein